MGLLLFPALTGMTDLKKRTKQCAGNLYLDHAAFNKLCCSGMILTKSGPSIFFSFLPVFFFYAVFSTVSLSFALP